MFSGKGVRSLDIQARILIVDDDEQILLVWHGALTGYTDSWQVEVAQSGQEALEMLKQEPFDLLVTDLRMPEMNGDDLTRTAQELQPDMPVIWITSFPRAQAILKAELLDVYCYLEKPLSIHKIREVVGEALSRCPVGDKV